MVNVALIGCGLIGRAWAVSFARGGCDVAMWDAAPGVAAAARDALPEVLRNLKGQGLLSDDPDTVLARVRLADSLDDALAVADYVQESTREDVATKRDVFAQLDALAAPDTILASSTSAILPSLFSEGLAGRARCLVAHPINPPYLIPAVELVPAPWTAPDHMVRAEAILKSVGQVPMVMQKELDGFIMNRMQGALLEEAFRLVADGYARPEDIDTGIRDGLALRWSFMGPFETIDLNAPSGVRDYVDRYGPLYERFASEDRGPRPDWTGPVLDRIDAARRKALPMKDLPDRQDWRDRRLMALKVHMKRAEEEFGQ